MYLGATYVWRPADTPKEHLYVVITDPKKAGDWFLMVNLTESVHGPASFIMRIGDHPYITKDSDVNFGDHIETDSPTLDREIQCYSAIQHVDMDLTWVEKIARRAMTHSAISPNVRKKIALTWK